MLVNPAIVVQRPLALVGTLLVVILANAIPSFLASLALGAPVRTALTLAAGLAQIGEFSFILAGLGVDLGLLPERGRNLILAGAILSILLNPLLFAGLDMLQAWRDKRRTPEVKPVQPAEEEGAAREPVRPTALNDYVVLVGHGRVGGVVSEGLAERKVPLLVIENDDERLAELKAQGIEAIAGNAADPEIIAAANLPAARCLLVAIPDAFEGGQVVEQARALNPRLTIIARAHSEAEVLHLKKHGASIVILGEHEIARAMVELVSPGEA
jgi:CPA2 family monovalent cation:H+ antiporter-2